jgi:hypothetical protein
MASLPVPFRAQPPALARNERFARATGAALAVAGGVLVKTALQRHAQVMRTLPVPDDFVRIVDGVAGALERQAKTDGKIEYHYSRIKLVLEYALEVLRALSPVRSGRYRGRHAVYVGGARLDTLSGWKSRLGASVLITNDAPYARKIEVGAMSMRVPGTDHVYAQAEPIIARRFGELADVAFIYSDILGGRPERAPALRISERRRG